MDKVFPIRAMLVFDVPDDRLNSGSAPHLALDLLPAARPLDAAARVR
jgi:hypothetical protein